MILSRLSIVNFKTSDTEKTFLSYKVITSVTETKKNCIAVSNADRKKRLNGTKKNMTGCRIISGLPP